LVNIRIYYCL